MAENFPDALRPGIRRAVFCLLLFGTGCGFYTRIEVADPPPGGKEAKREYLLLGFSAGEEPGTFVHFREKRGAGRGEWTMAGSYAGEGLQARVLEDGISLVVFYADNVRIYHPVDSNGAGGSGADGGMESEIWFRPSGKEKILAGSVWWAEDGGRRACAVVDGGEGIIFRTWSSEGEPVGAQSFENFPVEPSWVKVAVTADSTAYVIVLPRIQKAPPRLYKCALPLREVPKPLGDVPSVFRDASYFALSVEGTDLLVLVKSSEEEAELELWRLGGMGWSLEDSFSLQWPKFVFEFNRFDLHISSGRLYLYATNTQDVVYQYRGPEGWEFGGRVETGMENVMESAFVMLMAGAAFLVLTGAAMAWRTMRGGRVSRTVDDYMADYFPRAAAFMFDMLIIFTMFLGLGMAFGDPEAAESISPLDITALDLLVVFVVQQIVTMLYFTVTEVTLGRSMGKIFMGLMVVKADGTRAGRWNLLIRNLFRFVDFLPPVFPAGAPTLMPVFGALAVVIARYRQRVGDIVAGTYVVEQRAYAGEAAGPAPPLVLASASSKRAEILKSRGYEFIVAPPDAEEPPRREGETVSAYARRLAGLKNRSVRGTHRLPPGSVVLSADTVVAVGDKILGKPRDRDDAGRMLRMLASEPHRVITAITISKVPEDEYLDAWDSTIIELEMTNSDIEEYLETGKWDGSAGAYSIEDKDPFVTRMEGSRSNVEGLPVELFQELYSRITKRGESGD